MAETAFPWILVLLAIPGSVAAAGSLPIDSERFRRVALGSACLLFGLCVALPWAYGGFAGARLIDPFDPARLLFGVPIFRIDALSGLLLPFTALLWILAVGVTPKGALDRHGIRRTAAATLTTLAIFLTESPALLVALWAVSVLILLRGLEAGGYRRALRLSGAYLGLSILLLAAGVFAPGLLGDDPAVETGASICILLAVAIRKGIVPLHGWLPETFEHGRIGPAVLFTAPQVGAYVAIVLLLPRAPGWLLEAAALAALVTAVYGALAAMVQRDSRRAFGYLYISQASLVLAGLECVSVEGLTGALSLWLSSGVAFAALARCLAVLEGRRGRLFLDRLNGGYDRMPLLASSFLLTALAAVGFPGTLGFIGHELLVDGAVAQHPRTGFLLVVATALGGIALLRAYFALFCGRPDHGVSQRLRPRETVLFALCSALLIAGGLAPGAIVASREKAAARILESRGWNDVPSERDTAALRSSGSGSTVATVR